jgi:hypothetical protein
MTRAALIRKLTPGTQVIQVRNLRGACNNPRTVLSCSNKQVVFSTSDPKIPAYLEFNKGDEIQETENGFMITTSNDAEVEYNWV